MQALFLEDRVLQELEKIAFGDGPASGRLKALELLGKHVGLFKPKEVPVGNDSRWISALSFTGALRSY